MESDHCIDTHVASTSKAPCVCTTDDDDVTNLMSWSLPSSIVDAYRQCGITSFLPWQADCLRTPGVLDGKNLVFAAPTSSGKTLVAEILTLKRLIELRRKALFVLPFVSLAREKMVHLRSVYQRIGLRVDGYMSTLSPIGGIDMWDVAVCTIEKCNGLINRLIETEKLDLIGTVVVDELHTVGDRGRGHVLELLLTKLLFLAKKWKIQLQVIGMSATLPNLRQLADWLDAALYETDYRPIPLHSRLKMGETIYDSAMNLVGPFDPQFVIPGDSDNVAGLCLQTLISGHGTLLFCSTRAWCEKLSELVAKVLLKILRDNEHPLNVGLKSVYPSKESFQQFMADYRRIAGKMEPLLASTLPLGVAYHHAGLTAEEREVLERGFRGGILRILVATTTLSSGVNLPARRVIIRSPWGVLGRPGPCLTPSVYLQMVGRAGRKGLDTEGESILICKPAEAQRGKEIMAATLSEIRSNLISSSGYIPHGLKKVVLEAIAGGLVSSGGELEDFLGSSLLRFTSEVGSNGETSSEWDMATGAYKECLDYLSEQGFISMLDVTLESQGNDHAECGNGQVIKPTQLGLATLASSLSPDEALFVYKDLQRGRKHLCLETELHLVFLVTPLHILESWPGNFSWYNYYSIYSALPASKRSVGSLVGVRERFLTRAAHGQAVGACGKDANLERVSKRYYCALALLELIEEHDIATVAERFGFSKGFLQSLQQQAATYAGMVVAFCDRLGWCHLKACLTGMSERLMFGIRRDLTELVRVDGIDGLRAQGFYNSGFKTIASLAAASEKDIQAVLLKTIPFDSGAEGNRAKGGWLAGHPDMTIETATRLLSSKARSLLEQDLQHFGISIGTSHADKGHEVMDRSDLLAGSMARNHRTGGGDIDAPEVVDCASTKSTVLKMGKDDLVSRFQIELETALLAEKGSSIVAPGRDQADGGTDTPCPSRFQCDVPMEAGHPTVARGCDREMLVDSSSDSGVSTNNSQADRQDAADGDSVCDSAATSDTEELIVDTVEDNLCSESDGTFLDMANITADLLHQVSLSSSQQDLFSPSTKDILRDQPVITVPNDEHSNGRDCLSAVHDSRRSPSGAECDTVISCSNTVMSGIAHMGRVSPTFKPGDATAGEGSGSGNRNIDSLLSGSSTSPDLEVVQDLTLIELVANSNETIAQSIVESDTSASLCNQIEERATSPALFGGSGESPVAKRISPGSCYIESPSPDRATPGTRTASRHSLKRQRNHESSSSSSRNRKRSRSYRNGKPLARNIARDHDFIAASNRCELTKPDLPRNELHQEFITFNGGRFAVVDVLSSDEALASFEEMLHDQSCFSVAPILESRQDAALERDIPKIGSIFAETSSRTAAEDDTEVQNDSSSSNYQVVGLVFHCGSSYVYSAKFAVNLTQDASSSFSHRMLPLRQLYFESDKEKLHFDAKLVMTFLGGLSTTPPIFSGKWRCAATGLWMFLPEGQHGLESFLTKFQPSLLQSFKRLSARTESATNGIAFAALEAVAVSQSFSCLQKCLTRTGFWDTYVSLEMSTLVTIAKMEINGLRFDMDGCRKYRALLQRALKSLEAQAAKEAGRPLVMTCPRDLSTALFCDIGLPAVGDPRKDAKANRKKSVRQIHHSTAKGVLRKLEHLNPLPQIILSWRNLHNVLATAIYPLLRAQRRRSFLACESRRTHGTYNLHSATGRIVMSQPSLQILPKSVEIPAFIGDEACELDCYSAGRTLSIRGLFGASEDRCILSADYCQIELRILAHLSKDNDLVTILKHHETDIFKTIAVACYGSSCGEITDTQRQQVKRVCYGIIYGMGPRALADLLEVEEQDARRFQDSFKRAFPGVSTWMLDVINRCQKTGFVETLVGRRRFLPDILSPVSEKRKQAERQAVNTTVQGSAADLFKQGLVRVDEALDATSVHDVEGPPARILLQLHDEVVCGKH